MSAKQDERRAAHDAAVDARRVQVAPVLRDHGAARALAFTVVAEVLAQLAGRYAGRLYDAAVIALGEVFAKAVAVNVAGGVLPCAVRGCEDRQRNEAVGRPACHAHRLLMRDVRREADLLTAKLYVVRGHPRSWPWEARAPYEAAEALRRACEDDAALCEPTRGTVPCKGCNGSGLRHHDGSVLTGLPHPHGCGACMGTGREEVAPPLLALLLHDAHALLVDLRADPGRIDVLVREAVEKAMCDAGGPCRSCDETGHWNDEEGRTT